MINRTITPRTLAAMTLLLPGLSGACAHVGQEQFDAELASVRQQIEEGDRATQERVDNLGRLTEDQMEEMSARMDALARSLTTLQSEFDVTVERLESAVRFDMPVYFAFDQSAIRSEDRPVLDRFSTVVKEFYPEALITVEGFTDQAGSAEYNRVLGQKRADSVREYLVKLGGFGEGSVRSVSYGEDTARLVAPNQAGRDKGWENRRVALVIEHVGTRGDQADMASGSP